MLVGESVTMYIFGVSLMKSLVGDTQCLSFSEIYLHGSESVVCVCVCVYIYIISSYSSV